jgi:hypothetical protein
VVYPSDHQFEEAFAVFARQSAGQSKKLVRYLLYALEHELGGAEADFELDAGTVEHILPENPGSEWNEVFPPKEQSAYVYRLGNLTLLERNFNRDVANKGFGAKKKAYRKSHFAMARSIDSEQWTPSTVAARQLSMAKAAVKIWRADFER